MLSLGINFLALTGALEEVISDLCVSIRPCVFVCTLCNKARSSREVKITLDCILVRSAILNWECCKYKNDYLWLIHELFHGGTFSVKKKLMHICKISREAENLLF